MGCWKKVTFPLEKSGMDTAHSGKHNKRVGKLIASKAGATLEATRSARHDGKFSGVKRESKRGGSGASGTRRQHCRSGGKRRGKRDRKRCNRDKHSRWAAAAAAAVEQLSSHGRHGDKRGDRQDKRGVRRGKRGDQRGQQDTHGDRVTRAAASEA